MSSKVGKVLKIVLWTVGGLLALVVLLVATLPLWLGSIARPCINAAAAKMTQTEFNIGHLSLNPYTGRFELGSFLLGNPKGYAEPKAVEVGEMAVDVAMTTLGDKYVHVEEITIKDLFVSYVDGGDHDVDNFTQIQYNLAGGKEKYEAAKAKAEAAKELAEADAEAQAKKDAEAEAAKRAKMSEEELAAYEAELEADAAAEEAAKKKFVIDRLSVSGIRIKYGHVTIPVPGITLTDIGKKSDGVTLTELVDQVWQQMLNAAIAVGDGAKVLGGLIKTGVGAVGDGAKAAAGAVGDGAKAAAGAVGDGAKAAAGAVGDGAKAAAGAVGDGAKAVGEGAAKALDSVKGLFK